MKILYLNHKPSQCGVYEIGKRIWFLLNSEGLISEYREVEYTAEFNQYIDQINPDVIIYNYVGATMPFLTSKLTKYYSNIKHIGIIHDSFNFIDEVDSLFDRWIVHDLTNTTPSTKKFLTVRPIRYYERQSSINLEQISIGTHGFPISRWKMYDTIAEWVNYAFDNVTLNMNLPIATFGGTIEQAKGIADLCRSKITKSGVILNITHEYFETEIELINHLSQNTLNLYFYDDTVYNNLGVAGSIDLGISAQSSLAVNNNYMCRHIIEKLNYCTKDNIKEFVTNYKSVRELYKEWNPKRMTNDYKKMIETL